jgi:hypothetical protein
LPLAIFNSSASRTFHYLPKLLQTYYQKEKDVFDFLTIIGGKSPAFRLGMKAENLISC